MSVDYKVRAIYEEEIHDVTKSADKWKTVLRLAGNLYRYEFDNIIMIYAQKPRATLCADYDTWKLVDRFVKRGSKGIAIFPSRALNPRMRYVFDISDTGGKNKNLTWTLEGDFLKDYLDMLVSEGQIKQYDGTDRNTMMTSLKHFTKTEIRGIIEEEFEDRMSELMQLSGSVIKEFFTKRKGLPEDMSISEQLVFQSVMYVVGTRCGFDLSMQEQDFSQIVNVTDEDTIYRLGSLVCDVSCSVLKSFNRNLKTIENERRLSYGRDGVNVSRSGRTTISEHSDGETEPSESGQIRENGDEVSTGEQSKQIQDTVPIRDARGEDEGSGRGSEPVARPADGELSSETQTRESILNNGDVENQRTGEDAGRGSSASSSSDDLSLNRTSEDEELNRELNELNSFGNSAEAEYHQASFFDADFGLERKGQEVTKKAAGGYQYTYIEPKKELVVPAEYVKQTLIRGSGFENGRTRICKIYETEIDAGTRARLVKKEYGQGGAGWPLEGYGLHGYDTFHSQGLRFQWRDEEGEKEGYISWKTVEKEIGVLIMTGEYQPERQSLDEIAMDGDREDIIDADFREVEDIEPEEVEIIDSFAIPDEPESYESNRVQAEADSSHEMTPEELAEEDHMVTMAEYGAEMKAEAEKLEVIPTDYAQVIADMDEDKRDAMEILVTECSIYSPFHPFLQDLAASTSLLMPNRLEFLSGIALGDKEERTGYCNNRYGLVEYVMKPFEVQLNYKNRHGERVKDSTGYRELYEVLSYMSKQPFYCGEDAKARYFEMLIGDKEKMKPIYRDFLDKQKAFVENQEKQKAWSDSFHGGATNAEVSRSEPVETPVDGEKHNFHFNLWEVPKGGAKTRYQWNVDAIHTLKLVESEGRLATTEEQKTLSNYVGWGGLSQVFDEKNENWKEEFAEFK